MRIFCSKIFLHFGFRELYFRPWTSYKMVFFRWIWCRGPLWHLQHGLLSLHLLRRSYKSMKEQTETLSIKVRQLSEWGGWRAKQLRTTACSSILLSTGRKLPPSWPQLASKLAAAALTLPSLAACWFLLWRVHAADLFFFFFFFQVHKSIDWRGKKPTGLIWLFSTGRTLRLCKQKTFFSPFSIFPPRE